MSNEFVHSSVGTSMTQAEFEALGLHVCNSQATGDVIYASSAAQLSRLGIGATNTILTVVGGVPTWQAPLVTQTILLPAYDFIAVAGTPAAGLQDNFRVLDFDDTSQEDAGGTWSVPTKWNGGTMTANILWASAAAVVGACRWTLYYGKAAESDDLGVTFGSVTVDDTTDASAGDLNVTANMTLAAASLGVAGDLINFIVRRVAAHANDTLVGDARLIGLKITWTENSV